MDKTATFITKVTEGVGGTVARLLEENNIGQGATSDMQIHVDANGHAQWNDPAWTAEMGREPLQKYIDPVLAQVDFRELQDRCHIDDDVTIGWHPQLRVRIDTNGPHVDVQVTGSHRRYYDSVENEIPDEQELAPEEDDEEIEETRETMLNAYYKQRSAIIQAMKEMDQTRLTLARKLYDTDWAIFSYDGNRGEPSVYEPDIGAYRNPPYCDQRCEWKGPPAKRARK